ncbi:MAG TPA: hypothetical protein VGB97_01280 [Candidatus Paceibacterota bacterium]|jgi:hypothetical protein
MEVFWVAGIPLTIFLLIVLFDLVFCGPKLMPRLSRSGFGPGWWLTGVRRDRQGNRLPPEPDSGLVMAIRRDADGNERVEIDYTTNANKAFVEPGGWE